MFKANRTTDVGVTSVSAHDDFKSSNGPLMCLPNKSLKGKTPITECGTLHTQTGDMVVHTLCLPQSVLTWPLNSHEIISTCCLFGDGKGSLQLCHSYLVT